MASAQTLATTMSESEIEIYLVKIKLVITYGFDRE